MSVRAGQLDRRVLLQRPVIIRDNFGDAVKGWADVATVWAAFRPVTGGEQFQSNQRTATQTATFRIRYQAGIGPTMRVVHDGAPWEVRDVQELGRREELLLTADSKEVTPGG